MDNHRRRRWASDIFFFYLARFQTIWGRKHCIFCSCSAGWQMQIEFSLRLFWFRKHNEHNEIADRNPMGCRKVILLAIILGQLPVDCVCTNKRTEQESMQSSRKHTQKGKKNQTVSPQQWVERDSFTTILFRPFQRMISITEGEIGWLSTAHSCRDLCNKTRTSSTKRGFSLCESTGKRIGQIMVVFQHVQSMGSKEWSKECESTFI